jgi:putative transposase
MGSVRHHPVENDEIMHITTVTRGRSRFFQDPSFAREAIDTLYRIQNLRPFWLYGFVIMPDHCHLLLQIPSPERIRTIIGQFKRGTAHNIGQGPLWQKRYHLQITRDACATLRYIHENPVRAGLAAYPHEFPWSSACGRWAISDLLCL